VGGHIVGAEAGELMPVLTLAVNGGMNAEAFKDLIFVHPTLGENIWEAVGSVAGFSIHV
jgi:pyruvate/2-oxoglutarate dehydrogenase complex dihydrolipoamide dehydrogenase (E3) component